MKLKALIWILVLLAASWLATAALAQDGYDLSWWTADAGGVSNGSGYTLGGTIGQPDAGVLSGGGYTLTGGFWGGAVGRYEVYLPVVLRSYP